MNALFRASLSLGLAAALLAAPTLRAAEPPQTEEPKVEGSAARLPGAETPQALVERLNAAARADDVGEIANCLAPEDRTELVLGMVAATGMMVAFMQMGSDMAMEMAGGMAEGVAESLPEGEALSPEEKAEVKAGMEEEMAAGLEKGREEAKQKAAAMEKRYTALLEKHGLGDLLSDQGPDIELGQGDETRELLGGVDQGALLRDLMALLDELGDDEPVAVDRGEEDPLALPDTITDLQVEGDRATARAGEETLELVKIDGRWYFKPAREESSGAED